MFEENRENLGIKKYDYLNEILQNIPLIDLLLYTFRALAQSNVYV